MRKDIVYRYRRGGFSSRALLLGTALGIALASICVVFGWI